MFFSSDPAVSSSIFVGVERVENLLSGPVSGWLTVINHEVSGTDERKVGRSWRGRKVACGCVHDARGHIIEQMLAGRVRVAHLCVAPGPVLRTGRGRTGHERTASSLQEAFSICSMFGRDLNSCSGHGLAIGIERENNVTGNRYALYHVHSKKQIV